MSSGANVLAKSPKISDITKRVVFPLNFSQNDGKIG